MKQLGNLLLASAVVAVLALYRAGLFIHEITHLKAGALPGFKLAWNALVGVPLFVPSFMYEGVHNLHHARTRYGTVEDPEYLPLASPEDAAVYDYTGADRARMAQNRTKMSVGAPATVKLSFVVSSPFASRRTPSLPPRARFAAFSAAWSSVAPASILPASTAFWIAPRFTSA